MHFLICRKQIYSGLEISRLFHMTAELVSPYAELLPRSTLNYHFDPLLSFHRAALIHAAHFITKMAS